MAPSDPSDDDGLDGSQQPGGADTSAAEAALRARLSRKRTKTGCLTCRKRRIKCTEERPVCRNCVKSKRHCEGYSQRVVFKPPTFDFRAVAHGGAHITFQAGPLPGSMGPNQNDMMKPPFDPSLYSDLRPRPSEQYAMPAVQPVHYHHMSAQAQYYNPPVAHNAHVMLDSSNQHAPPNGVQYPAWPGAIPTRQPMHAPNAPRNGFQHTSGYGGHPVQPVQRFTLSDASTSWPPQHTPTEGQVAWESYGPIAPPAISPTSTLSSRTWPARPAPANGDATQQWISPTFVPRPELAWPLDYQAPPLTHAPGQFPPEEMMAPLQQSHEHNTPELYEYEKHASPTLSPSYVLNAAAVETLDDDYYDVQSDDEMDVDVSVLSNQDLERQQTLNRILQLNQISVQDLHTRRYDTFICDGMLDRYRVERVANPLRNAPTARIFAHFIAVTGPSLSIFERHPRNTSVLFTDGQIPMSQQGLWTYTMPMAALHHQGLLHAMLALASLHIAKLTGASITPSFQHYAWALKRVHHSVGHPKKRLQLSTIAASMLLGFYEIMTADHMKWNMHLAGSKQLFVETDFVRMTRQFKRMKQEGSARSRMGAQSHSDFPAGNTQAEQLAQIPNVDERLISNLVGREVRYDDHGEIMTPQSGIPQELDLHKFEILKDLYWWYCKQDAYQSIISGNPLLMDYGRWADCPPRAPLGRPNAVYGSFDHLILLLARIADFSSRDRSRKLRQMKLNGGQWKPSPSMHMPQPPRQNAPPTPVSASSFPSNGAQAPTMGPQRPSSPQGPAFYGMAPPPRGNVQMPASYARDKDAHPPSDANPVELMDLHTATQAALEEYGRIRAALHIFSAGLGDAFQPLTPEEQLPIQTPFGPSLSYRSYDIGCLWAIYNMAEIIAVRSHPHMPPAAHAATAVAAKETAFYAHQIGRIAAGIVPGPVDQPLNPSLGGALCESTIPSFFAAIQYQDARQRHSTVSRIYSIAQRTGWRTAELIASGCETAWVKAAAAGRGPPYERVMQYTQSDDPRLNGSWQRLDPDAQPDEADEYDRRFVRKKALARLNWGIGVLGMEDDVKVPE